LCWVKSLEQVRENDLQVLIHCEGNFSVVRRASFNGKTVAAKLITNRLNRKILKEVEILQTVNHPNCIHYFGVAKIKERESDYWSKYCILLVHVSLFTYIHTSYIHISTATTGTLGHDTL
jgi:serine/threonine protein kinase